MTTHPQAASAVPDVAEQGYSRQAYPFFTSEPYTMDARYCMAQLPLVNPQHPNVIAQGDYGDGPRHMGVLLEPVVSIVAMVPPSVLVASASFALLWDELQRSAIAPKIAWDMWTRRVDKLHCTLAAHWTMAQTAALQAQLDASQAKYQAMLSATPPITLQLQGLFAGGYNCGRLYFKVKVKPEPQSLRAVDPFAPLNHIRQTLGHPARDVYLVGAFNLTDDLTVAETQTLAALIQQWQHTLWGEFELRSLNVLQTWDDLILNAQVLGRVGS